MKTPDFAIQPCQSKFTFWKVKASKNFIEFTIVFQTSLNPKKLAQIQESFASRNFKSNSISNLNLFPKGMLFPMFHYIGLQSLVNFGLS
jgi:uncharacterized membrane protein